MSSLDIDGIQNGSAEYRVTVQDGNSDPEWDSFLDRIPSGHSGQTTAWARAKAASGWRSVRIIVHDTDKIAAGAQILYRPIAVAASLGSVAYITKGPACAPGHEPAIYAFLQGLNSLAGKLRLLYCVLQPPENSSWDSDLLLSGGYRPSRLELAPSTTVRIDLASDEEKLLGRMKSKTRYNIRHGSRKGIQVREGDDHDLGIFYRLLERTAARQGFTADSLGYFHALFRELGPRAGLFLAEKEGEALSAALVITHRETAYYKRGAWSGSSGKYHPNEVMHWQIMRWAKAQGLRYYDLEGIDAALAQPWPETGEKKSNIPRTVSSFKLGFGGDVLRYPKPFERVYNRLFGIIYELCGREKGMLWAKEKLASVRAAMET